MKKIILGMLLTLVIGTATSAEVTAVKTGDVIEIGYQGFTIWLDCNIRGAIKFRYNAQRDTDNYPRFDKFMTDTSIPKECQQTSTETYGHDYDRGHMVPANHMDSDPVAITQTNYMTNIWPQRKELNRGAWLRSEEIIECLRDLEELHVLGGPIFTKDTHGLFGEDLFIQSHGIRTPDQFWKVIIKGVTGKEMVIAWLMPNDKNATRANLDKYIVTVAEIEKHTGETISVPNKLKKTKPRVSWPIQKGCNKG